MSESFYIIYTTHYTTKHILLIFTFDVIEMFIYHTKPISVVQNEMFCIKLNNILKLWHLINLLS